MHLVAEVGGVRIAIVHGDAESLAGWNFSHEALMDDGQQRRVGAQFVAAKTRVFASSHTCLPLARDFDTPQGACMLINNGAAGMPNFSGTHYGVITRIPTRRATHVTPLYGTRIGEACIDALPLHYDQARWQREFLANWPEGSPAHISYFQRITAGPSYDVIMAAQLGVSLAV